MPSIESLQEPLKADPKTGSQGPGMREKSRSVSFVQEEEADEKNKPIKSEIQELTSDGSVPSRQFEMHVAWRKLGDEQVSKVTRCQSSLPSESINTSAPNIARRSSAMNFWAIAAMLSLFLESTGLPMVVFLPPGVHWLDAFSVATAARTAFDPPNI